MRGRLKNRPTQRELGIGTVADRNDCFGGVFLPPCLYDAKTVTLALIKALVVGLVASSLTAANPQRKHDERVFEYRVYTVHPEKMSNLLARFGDHIGGIFERLGAENIGYGVETEPAAREEPKLHYIIAHPSREASQEFWATFRDAADWKAA